MRRADPITIIWMVDIGSLHSSSGIAAIKKKLSPYKVRRGATMGSSVCSVIFIFVILLICFNLLEFIPVYTG